MIPVELALASLEYRRAGSDEGAGHV